MFPNYSVIQQRFGRCETVDPESFGRDMFLVSRFGDAKCWNVTLVMWHKILTPKIYGTWWVEEANEFRSFSLLRHTKKHLSKVTHTVSGCFRKLTTLPSLIHKSLKTQPPNPHPSTNHPPFLKKNHRRKNLHEGEAVTENPGGPSEPTVRNQRETSAESLPGHGSSSCSTVSRAKVWGVVDFLGLKS